MMSSILRHQTLLIALTLTIAPLCRSQGNFGQINGSVSDASDAPIPAAQVRLQNLDNGAEREAQSGAAGSYVIPNVSPGRYRLSFSAPGMQTNVVPEFRLQVSESRTFDVVLPVGEVAETVEVQAAPVAVNQTDSTVGTVIQETEIVEIPLNGRNFAQLIQLSPGASPAAVGQQQAFGITGGFSPAVNGLRHMMNNFTLDGVENNMRFTNSFGAPPPPDALEEFKISTHQSDAAAALAAGANINLVTKSGTNDFHGAMWDFIRNDKFAANGFFNNLFANEKLPYRQNQFGYYFGGPVFVPKVFDGRKSRTYFSTYYEGTRFRRTSATTATVPSLAVRAGDFSELLGDQVGTDCVGRPVFAGQMYDPFTTRENGSCPQGMIRDPFPNNQIPAIHPVAQQWLRYLYPESNRPGVPNLVLSQASRLDSNQWGARIDQYIHDRHRVFGRASFFDYQRRNPSPLPANVALNVNKGANVAFNYNFVIDPTLVYEFSGGYNRASIPFGQEPLGQEFRDAVGPDFAPEVPLGFLPSTQALFGSRYAYPQFVSYDLANPDDAFQYNNSLKKVAGKHTLSFGFNLLHWRHRVGVQGTSQLQYSPQTTGLPGFTSTGEPMASFFVGLPTNTRYGFGLPKTTRGNVYVGYAGDTWKATQRLTLNLGLQYAFAEPATGNEVSAMNIHLARSQPLATDFAFAFQWTSTNPITGEPPNARDGLLDPDRNNFAPRFGFAYSLFKNTVVRGGIGVFYDYNTNLIQNNPARSFSYPFTVTRSIAGQNLTFPGSVTLDDPYVEPVPGTATLGAAFDPLNRDPYAINWNFGIEHMLPGANLLSVNYVASGGRKLVTNVQQNMAPASPEPVNPRRPWPNAPSSFFLTQNVQSSNYHSLQVKLERRFSSGLTFRNSYTWSKVLDFDSDPNSAQLDYSYDFHYSYGPATFHIPHVNSTSVVYLLPFGPGRPIGSNWRGLPKHLLGGWQISGIVSIRAGQSYHVLSGQDSANTGNFIASSTTRSDIVSAPVPDGFEQTREEWIDRDAFRVPQFGTLGNQSRNSLLGPAFQNFDIALLKDFYFHEELALQLRAEFFNAFNHTNFGNPVNSLASPLFGSIQSAFAQREVQFALKLHW